MAFHRVLMVIGLLLVASFLAEGDAQQKDQKTSADVKQARPEWHHGGWSGGGWGGGGWGGGGRGGGWGGGGWGGGGRGGGFGGGGWGGGGGGGGGGHGGGWGGGGCRYRCGHHCCSPQEIAKIEQIEAMDTERMTAEVKPEGAVGKEGYGGGGYGGGGGHGGGWGGGGGGHGGGWGGGCHYWCGRHCCGSPEEMAKFKRDVEMTTDMKESNEVKPEGHGGDGGGGGWGGGGGGYGGGCRRWCGHHCCTPAEMANNPELSRSESETKNKEAVGPKTVKQGEVKN